MPHSLPKLSYSYDALEPHIDARTMEIHYTKHHQAYVDNLNKALEKYPELQKKSIEELLVGIDSVPDDIKQAVINHGGGHANHSFFWEILCPAELHAKCDKPKGELAEAINSIFGGFDKFKQEFEAKAMGVFGSGWAFLIKTPDGTLKLKRHSFQNSPLMDGNIPIFGIDVWEHAYYLKFQNRKAEYVKAFWNVVNWEKISENFSKSLK